MFDAFDDFATPYGRGGRCRQATGSTQGWSQGFYDRIIIADDGSRWVRAMFCDTATHSMSATGEICPLASTDRTRA